MKVSVTFEDKLMRPLVDWQRTLIRCKIVIYIHADCGGQTITCDHFCG